MKWLARKLNFAHFEQGGEWCMEIIVFGYRVRIGSYDTGIYKEEL